VEGIPEIRLPGLLLDQFDHGVFEVFVLVHLLDDVVVVLVVE
jgi:hypothetical protein